MRISDWSSDVCSSDLGLERDPAQARRLLEMAAAAGDPNAERDLGYALITPNVSSFTPDLERGLRLLTLAPRKGDSYATELLGRTFLEGGRGLQHQPAAARAWLSPASDEGAVRGRTAAALG